MVVVAKIIEYFFKRQQIKNDQILFYLWPPVAAGIALLASAEFFSTLFLFFGLPTLYLAFRNKDKLKKAIIFSLSGLVVVTVLDYIPHLTGVWAIMNSPISYRFLGYVTVENIIWLPLYVLFLVMYYEYFLEFADRDKLVWPRLKYIYTIFSAMLMVFLFAYVVNRDWLYINYFYLAVGLAFVLLPILLVLYFAPKLFPKLAKAGLYFCWLSFIYELTALRLAQWTFPGGGVIGMVSLGPFLLPVEELVFWIMLGAMGILALYEFFDDDIR